MTITTDSSGFSPPSEPDEPVANGSTTGSAGQAVSIIIRHKFAAEETELFCPSPDQDVPFPLAPSVEFYNDATGERLEPADIKVTWERHEGIPGLPGIQLKFVNQLVAPLKAGEILRIGITG